MILVRNAIGAQEISEHQHPRVKLGGGGHGGGGGGRGGGRGGGQDVPCTFTSLNNVGGVGGATTRLKSFRSPPRRAHAGFVIPLLRANNFTAVNTP